MRTMPSHTVRYYPVTERNNEVRVVVEERLIGFEFMFYIAVEDFDAQRHEYVHRDGSTLSTWDREMAGTIADEKYMDEVNFVPEVEVGRFDLPVEGNA